MKTVVSYPQKLSPEHPKTGWGGETGGYSEGDNEGWESCKKKVEKKHVQRRSETELGRGRSFLPCAALS